MTFELLTPGVRRAGVRAFVRIADQWELTTDERAKLLGLRSPALLDNLTAPDAEVADRVIERVSLVIGIYVALTNLFGSAERQRQLLRASNRVPLFSGQSALDLMTSGEIADAYAVRRYLDAQLW